MNIRILQVMVSCLLMVGWVLKAQAQAIPSYVDEINYSVDISHVNDGGIGFTPNKIASDYVNGTSPNSTISPAQIIAVSGANIDGFHQDIDGNTYFSFDADTRVNGFSVLKSDIIRCNDFNCDSFSFIFSAVSRNFQHINIDAFTFDSENGDLIFSVDSATDIEGSGYFPADMIRFDGSDYSLEYNAINAADGIGAYKNINAISMLTTGEYGISLEEDGDYKGEFSYDNHWILKFAPKSHSWQLFYTILDFGDFENPLKITSLMIQENDLIFRHGFD